LKTLGIITYNAKHLKTEQLILNLVGRYNITVYALPFIARPARKVLFQHRPNQADGVHPREICEYLNIPFNPVEFDWEIDNGQDFYLIAGAGILSAQCLREKLVLNGHPGIIPAVRGLDAFKWSIYNMCPLGVTLHYVDENIDAGQVIAVRPTPVFFSDTLESLARRHYENEIRMLTDFEKYISAPVNPFKDISKGDSMRRMKHEQESELGERFLFYKQQYCR